MREELFKKAEEYDKLLNEGLKLSGESKDFFARGRLTELARLLYDVQPVRRILDFGCGIGDTTSLLADFFPQAEVVGLDLEAEAIEYARSRFARDRLTYMTHNEWNPQAQFDLCYVNGVFHHIDPLNRPDVLRFIHNALKPGGRFAFFENNPLNPATRLLMRRIPFDRNAKLVTPRSGRRLLREAGFTCVATRYLFFFPRVLRWVRWMEAGLKWIPFGAQYLVLASKPLESAVAPVKMHSF